MLSFVYKKFPFASYLRHLVDEMFKQFTKKETTSYFYADSVKFTEPLKG